MKQVQYADHFMTIDEVVAITRFSRAKIYRLIKAGEFPAQRKIGASARWVASEVHAWIAGQPLAPQVQIPVKRRVKFPKKIKRELRVKRREQGAIKG